jgi:ABC-2 type transport system ATP-binding protein
MSITVKNLTKVFGTQKALDNISFTVNRGEILGFLGPNGAGKSTTMKIATCYLPPTEGEVWVDGLNVMESPIQVKKKIGYLPEHNPLYLEMYVHEYLHFAGRVFGLKGKHLKSRTSEMIELCGLTREQNKKIEALSKGYRQRVGLAQALIHDPDVLILDEPTTGLDPNQIVEIRNVIKQVSVDKTVLFSTHIMQEVQALCDRVIVINKGKIVADDKIEHLRSEAVQTIVITLEFSESIDESLLQNLEGIIRVSHVKKGQYLVEAHSSGDVRPAIFKLATEQKLTLVGMQQEEENMEKIFQRLTQSDR